MSFHPVAAECNNDLDCSDQKACINFQCVNPCSLKGACGENAQCKTVQHRPRCSCPECYLGSAQTGCYPDPKCSQTQPRPAGQAVCFTDSDCDNKLACELNTGKCVNPCERQGVKCKDDKKCQVHYHKPTCVCKKGFMVNERGEISCAPEKAECSNDTQCPDNRACIDRLCQNPCTARPESPPCAPDKGCDVVKHKPTCICLKNCSPSLSICLRDSGCSADQACRAFRCENPCDTANCPENTPCRVEDHKPVCEHCPPGYKQDPKYGCFKGKDNPRVRERSTYILQSVINLSILCYVCAFHPKKTWIENMHPSIKKIYKSRALSCYKLSSLASRFFLFLVYQDICFH